MSDFIKILKPIRIKGKTIMKNRQSFIKRVRITTDQKDFIDQAAKKLGISSNYFIKWIIVSAAYAINKDLATCKEANILHKRLDS